MENGQAWLMPFWSGRAALYAHRRLPYNVTIPRERTLALANASAVPIGAADKRLAPPAVSGMTFVNWQEPIGCGGVAIYPDDVVVADRDGAIVIPKTLVDALVQPASEQEELEAWILSKVLNGAALSGLYPP